MTIALMMVFGLGASAQTDGFFNDWEDFDNIRNEEDLPTLPGSHGLTGNQEAPLGSGILILTALGAGYAISKKRD